MTKKILVVGKEDEKQVAIPEGLSRAFVPPPGLFEPPAPPPAPYARTFAMNAYTQASTKALLESDLAYLTRLRQAFTRTQEEHFETVRAVVMTTHSWRESKGKGRYFGLEETFYMPEWITDNGKYRQEGRTFLLAVTYLEKALTHPGARIKLEDHFGEMGDDLLDSQVKDLVEVDNTIRRRASFACRGELVICSEEQLKSL